MTHRIRSVVTELREARERLRAALSCLQEALEGRPDLDARVTERTSLMLRGGRLFLRRGGRADVEIMDPDVPPAIVGLAVEALAKRLRDIAP
jgi:hypothetical protein